MITVLNGSPNQNGHTNQLYQALFKDHDTHIHFNAYDMNVSACDDCKVCDHKPYCKFQDDHQALLKAIDASEAFIILTPVYFGAFSDQVLKVINRFQQRFAYKQVHKKPTPALKSLYVITTAGFEGQDFAGIEVTTNILKTLFNHPQTHVFSFAGTDGVKDPITHFKHALHTYQKEKNSDLWSLFFDG